jgi:hypothetical protein
MIAALIFRSAPAWAGYITDLATVGAAGVSTVVEPEAQDLPTPSVLLSLLRKLPQATCDFALTGSAGTSSCSSSDDVPPLELVGLLRPATGPIHPSSRVSFVFRPPRAA